MLSQIPVPDHPSYLPLATLTTLLESNLRRWPTLDLLRKHIDLWKCLPEEAKAGRSRGPAKDLVDRALLACKKSYASIFDFLHDSLRSAALIEPETRASLTHAQLAQWMRSFRLPASSGFEKPVVAIALPNGPLLALTVLATATYFVAAPLAYGAGVEADQFRADVLQSQSSIILAQKEDADRLDLRGEWVRRASIRVVVVEMGPGMLPILSTFEETPWSNSSLWPASVPNTADDACIRLFTSGTSGTKKVVPLSVHSVICGVSMVIHSWGLSYSMRCLNQMPLHHVGGIIRNLFAPIMSGGSIICCQAFDPHQFWDCVEDLEPTWFYASPSMHHAIIEAAEDRVDALAKSRIQLVCNAAGGLLPSLASRIRATFSVCKEVTVLPSYGMTECMPISTPPLTYNLDRAGTSGVSVGPEMAILDTTTRLPIIESGLTGHIAIRGPSLFSGYLKVDGLDSSCFDQSGWFDTGDMGYLDKDGFVFVTGRSKEVINRGGELISPFEIEEVVMGAAGDKTSPIFGRISKVVAFSVPHNVLQEVVGIAVVTPPSAQRVCLRSLQRAIQSTLAPPKIPVLIVYLNGGLPENNNKVLRIRLAERLQLPELFEGFPPSQQYYEAQCPPPNTALDVPIPCRHLTFSYEDLLAACAHALGHKEGLEFHVCPDESGFYPRLLVASRNGSISSSLFSEDTLTEQLKECVPGYSMPNKISTLDEPLPRSVEGLIDIEELELKLQPKHHSANTLFSDSEAKVAMHMAAILNIELSNLIPDSDFFSLGGDSMRAGKLLSSLRREFKIRLAVDVLFSSRTISALASAIDAKQPPRKSETDEMTASQNTVLGDLPHGCTECYSSSNPFLMAFHLIPLLIIYPMKRAFTWTVFIYCLGFLHHLKFMSSMPGRLLSLCISLALCRAVTMIVAPLVLVATKWLVIGKYREGLYPMWGAYHNRWWFVQKVAEICGSGIFDTFNWTRVLYYRMLGVRIGQQVIISPEATIGEYDLIELEDNVVLERCKVRPFAAERNTSMYLGRIKLGAGSSVGLDSIIAAGTTLAPGTCLGPCSSSWETYDANESNRDLGMSQIPKPLWIFELLLEPLITLLVRFVGAMPWLAALVGLAHQRAPFDASPVRAAIKWFSTPYRVGFHYLGLAANSVLGPVFLFLAVWSIKKLLEKLCGGPLSKCSPARGRSHFQRFRMQLIRDLMPTNQFQKLSSLFGTHYEGTSVLARMMGAQVGKRVYWPGNGPVVTDWDLINIGDDVVFGSRSYLVTSDGIGSERMQVEKGAMVADRVVLLPGAKLGEGAALGSGVLAKRNGDFPAGTTWIGSKGGTALCLTSQGETEKSNSPRTALGHDVHTDRPGEAANSASEQSSITLASRPVSLRVMEKSIGLPGSAVETIFDAGYEDLRPKAKRSSSPSHSSQDASEETTSPFGRAFYHGQAPYRVWGQLSIFVYSTTITVAVATYWNISSIAAIQVIGHCIRRKTAIGLMIGQNPATPVLVYSLFCALIIVIMAAQCALAVCAVILSKWIIIGRRQPGNYDWDKSSYCQRWQLFLKIDSLRVRCYGGKGVLGLLSGTEWAVLYFRAMGAEIGRNCSIFASGTPSLYFTEPDLLTLGDRVAVDDASLVAHINTRGKFDLNALSVGDRSVLRSGSRLLSGARMEADACLLEHTLVMAGDVVEEGSTLQRWPAEEFPGSRTPTLKVMHYWGTA